MTDFRQDADEDKGDHRLWQAILRTAVDPIILIDERGMILRANDATYDLLGFPVDELIGRSVSILMPEPFRSEHDGYLERYLTTGEARIIGTGREVIAMRSDGSTLPISLSVSEVETTGSRLFTGILHDLTNRRLIEAELRDLNAHLEQRVADRTSELEVAIAELSRSNRDLEQFAYIASHDLQTPLRNVRQGLELLDEHLESSIGHGFDDEANELRSLTVSAVSRMEDLIRGLLTYSRVQRQGRSTEEQVDLNEILSDVLEELAPEIAESDTEVSVDPAPEVFGDRIQLHQLFLNLVQNAVRYRSSDRRPSIRIQTVAGDRHVQIRVVDNGIGIEESQHGKVFELFRRAHAGSEGVGLGLAICQRIVERHGGEILLESTPEVGTTFSFSLPTPPKPPL